MAERLGNAKALLVNNVNKAPIVIAPTTLRRAAEDLLMLAPALTNYTIILMNWALHTP